MTREEFKKLLDTEGYPYEEEGDNLIVSSFNYIWLDYLTIIPSGVEFTNRGNLYLTSLKEIPSGTKFSNGGDISLKSVKSIQEGVEFHNEGVVNLRSMFDDGWFHHWDGNIGGINSKRLLNKMISLGLLDKKR
jgi:hypothetical protein